MKATENTNAVLRLMHILSWVIFIGLCINAGAFLVSLLVSVIINPEEAGNHIFGLNLSELFQFSLVHFVALVLLLIIIACLKAWIFFLVIKIFRDANMTRPFSTQVHLLISNLSYVALNIGILSIGATLYVGWLNSAAGKFERRLEVVSGGDQYLYFAGIIFIISLVFKRGIEIQSENELTV